MRRNLKSMHRTERERETIILKRQHGGLKEEVTLRVSMFYLFILTPPCCFCIFKFNSTPAERRWGGERERGGGGWWMGGVVIIYKVKQQVETQAYTLQPQLLFLGLQLF